MKDEDSKKKEAIEVKNHLDNSIYQTEKSLNEHRSKLSEQVIQEVEQSL